jgi:hypothetical protein
MPQCSKRWRTFNVQVRFNSSKSALKLSVPGRLADRVRLSQKPNRLEMFSNNRLVPQQVCAKQDLKVQLNAHNKPLKLNKQEVSRRRSLLALSVRKAHKPVFKQLRRRVNLACRLRN